MNCSACAAVSTCPSPSRCQCESRYSSISDGSIGKVHKRHKEDHKKAQENGFFVLLCVPFVPFVYLPNAELSVQLLASGIKAGGEPINLERSAPGLGRNF